MKIKNNGFTLIELMIVIAVIGVLVSIAVPTYQSLVSKSIINSCLQETKSYANEVLYSLHDQDVDSSPSTPKISACDTITDARNWTTETQQKIVATVHSPTRIRIECDVPNGGSCKVMP